MANKAKPRWDLAAVYVLGGPPIVHLKKDELKDIIGKDIPEKKLMEFLAGLNWRINAYLLTAKSLRNTNFPTDKEYKATCEDLIGSINEIDYKLDALNSSPFEHMVDVYLANKCPEQLPCELIDNTAKNLRLIKDAAVEYLENMEIKPGRRKAEHNNVHMLAGIARSYEKYTGKKPKKYCGDTGEGEFAKLARLFYKKTHEPITKDFCNQVKQAVDEYRNPKTTL